MAPMSLGAEHNGGGGDYAIVEAVSLDATDDGLDGAHDEEDLVHRGFNVVLRRSGRLPISVELWFAFREWLQASVEEEAEGEVETYDSDANGVKSRDVRRRVEVALHGVQAYDEWMAELELEMNG